MCVCACVRACVRARVCFSYAPANLAINGRRQEKTHRNGVLTERLRCAARTEIITFC